MRGYELNSNQIVIEFEHGDSFDKIAEASEFGRALVGAALEQYKIPNNLEKCAVVVKHDDASGLVDISPLVTKSYEPKQKRYLWEPPTEDYPEAYKRKITLPKEKSNELMKEYYQQEEAIHQMEEPGAPPLTQEELEKIETESSKFPAGPAGKPGIWESSIGGDPTQEEAQYELATQKQNQKNYIDRKVNQFLKQNNLTLKDLSPKELADLRSDFKSDFLSNFILLSSTLEGDGHLYRLKNIKKEPDGSIVHWIKDLETGESRSVSDKDFREHFKIFSQHQRWYDRKLRDLAKEDTSQGPTQDELAAMEEKKDLGNLIHTYFQKFLAQNDLLEEDLTKVEKKQIKDSIKKDLEEDVETPDTLAKKPAELLPEEIEEAKAVDTGVPEKHSKEKKKYTDQIPKNEELYDEAIAQANRYEKLKSVSIPKKKFENKLKKLIEKDKEVDPKLFWKWYEKEKDFEEDTGYHEEGKLYPPKFEASAFTKDELIKLGFTSDILSNLSLQADVAVEGMSSKIYLNRWANDVYIISNKPFQRALFTVKHSNVKKSNVSSLYHLNFAQREKLKGLGFDI